MKWTFASCPLLQIGISFKNQNRMANSVDPDGTAHYEPSHQDLHCLHRVSGLVFRAERVKWASGRVEMWSESII